MTLLKKITYLWNTLLRKMRKQEEMLDTNGRTGLAFPTTGIIGAIAGDCFGAAYEFHPVKHGDFDIYKEPRFMDDTVMTLAVAKWLTSVPESIISYLEADSYTSTIRNAISLGGDADTMACMAGGIAVATKGMELPEELARYVYNNVLDDNLRQILDEFNRGY